MGISRRRVLALAASLPLVACTTGQPTLRGEAILFTAGPLSGGQSESGQAMAGGVRLAADRVNRAGGVLGGRKVVVRTLNDEASPDVARQVADQIATAAKSGTPVLGVVGHFNSSCTLAGLPVYQSANLAVVTPSSSNPSLTKSGFRTFFRVCAHDATQGPVAADYLMKAGYKRIAVPHTDNLYAEGLAKEFATALAGKGGTVTADIRLKQDAPSFAASLAPLTAAPPDAIFFAGDAPDGIILVRDLRRALIQVPLLLSDSCFAESLIDELGTQAEGVTLTTISPDPKVVANAEWVSAYRAIEARNPGFDSTNGFSAAEVLLAAVKTANSASGDKVADALRAVDLTSVIGRIRYDDDGDLVDQRVYVYKVENRQFRQVS